MSKELIRLTDCVMSYDGDVVLDHITCIINDQEFLTAAGSQWCGKTTTRPYHRRFCRLPPGTFFRWRED